MVGTAKDAGRRTEEEEAERDSQRRCPGWVLPQGKCLWTRFALGSDRIRWRCRVTPLPYRNGGKKTRSRWRAKCLLPAVSFSAGAPRLLLASEWIACCVHLLSCPPPAPANRSSEYQEEAVVLGSVPGGGESGYGPSKAFHRGMVILRGAMEVDVG